MGVGIGWSGVAWVLVCGWLGAGGAFHVETILYESDAETSARAVLCGVGGVEEVCKEETDELEGHGDHAIPDKRKYGANGKALDVDIVGTTEAWRKDCSFPVGWCGICCGLFIGLDTISTMVSQ